MRIVPWLTGCAVVLAAGCASTNSSNPPPATQPTALAPATAAPGRTVNGTIQNYTQAPSGQQNGFVLANGERIQFPEQMGSKVSDQFPPNTQVQVTGRMITDADGRAVLAADQISAPDRHATLDLTAVPGAPASPSSGSSIGGAGSAGTQPVTPPPTDQPVSPTNPPPAGR